MHVRVGRYKVQWGTAGHDETAAWPRCRKVPTPAIPSPGTQRNTELFPLFLKRVSFHWTVKEQIAAGFEL